MKYAVRRLVGLRGGGELLPAWARYWRTRTRYQRLAITAAEVLFWEDAHLCLVSRRIADEMRVWSEPVQFMVEPRNDGLVELVMRVVDASVKA